MTEAKAAVWARSSVAGQTPYLLARRNPTRPVTPDIEALIIAGERESFDTYPHFIDRNGLDFWLIDQEGFMTFKTADRITGTEDHPFYIMAYALEPADSDGTRAVNVVHHVDGERDTLDFSAKRLRSWEYNPTSTAYWLKGDDGQYFVLEANRAVH